MKVTSVLSTENGDTLTMTPVCRKEGYPGDGGDEDNTYAKFSPSGELKLQVQNPKLIGAIKPGETYYVDFTLVVNPPAAETK